MADDHTCGGAAAPGLLERDDELRELGSAITAARDGTGALIVVEGGPGIGKTALLAAARAMAAKTGMLVLHARAGRLEREFSFGVARQLFGPLILRASSAGRARLFGGADAAVELVGPQSLPVGGDVAAPANAASLDGLFRLTANLTAVAPVVLCVDDLHWSDTGSLDWLAYLVRRIPEWPVLVLAAVHSPVPERESLGEATAGARHLRPVPLGRQSVRLLLADGLDADPSDAFAVTAHAATGGNPRLLRQLIGALAEQRVMPTDVHGPRCVEVGAGAIAPTVRLRLAAAGPAAAAVAHAAAILGERASLEHAAALAGVDLREAAVAATALGRAGLLRLDSSLSFAHPLEEAAVYSTIPQFERQVAHADAARMLADERAPAPVIASHLLRAPAAHESFTLGVLRDAARASFGDGQPEQAVALLRRALAEPLDDERRVEVLLELGRVEALVDLSAAARHLRDALALLDVADRRSTQIGLELARTLALAGSPREAAGAFEQAIVLVGPGREDLLSRLQADLLGATMVRSALYPIAKRQLQRIEPSSNDGLGEHMLLAMTAYYDARGGRDMEDCADRAERALADDRLLEEECSTAFAFACRVLVVADRFEAATTAYRRVLESARARGSVASICVGLTFRGGLAIHRGALADAELDVREAVVAARSGGVALALPFSLTYLALTLLEQGDLEGAAEALGEFPRESGGFGDLPFFLLVSGRLQRAEGNADVALSTILEAAAGYAATGQRNPALAAWRSEAALARLDLGDRDGARKLAAEEVVLATVWGAPRALSRALRVAGLAEGGEPGLALLRESLAVVRDSPARLERAKTLVELGCAVRRNGQRSEARALLRRRLDLADACGARPLADQARVDLRAAGARPRRARLTGIHSLTAGERRVAALAVDGMTNREIANALVVTANTVEVHLSSVYRKLEIRSRASLPLALGTRPAASPQS
jgi:DNA-binding CsgD family transcriptional regulator